MIAEIAKAPNARLARAVANNWFYENSGRGAKYGGSLGGPQYRCFVPKGVDPGCPLGRNGEYQHLTSKASQ